MNENEHDALNTNEAPDSVKSQSEKSPAIPKPVFMRLLMLFGGGIGCLLVGVIVSLATGDLITLAMSAILCAAFITKGALLKRKIALGQIYSVSGVCVSIVPKILGRYRRIELVNTDTGDDVHFVLPKKVLFKIGHVYNCYFDHHINNRPGCMGEQDAVRPTSPVSENNAKGGFFNTELDLPVNGFLGFEDFGVYQEKPVTAVITATAADSANDAEAVQNIENEEEDQCKKTP